MQEEPPTQSNATPANDLGEPEAEERAEVDAQIDKDAAALVDDSEQGGPTPPAATTPPTSPTQGETPVDPPSSN